MFQNQCRVIARGSYIPKYLECLDVLITRQACIHAQNLTSLFGVVTKDFALETPSIDAAVPRKLGAAVHDDHDIV